MTSQEAQYLHLSRKRYIKTAHRRDHRALAS